MSQNIIEVTAKNGVPFTVELAMGDESAPERTADPVIRFYDARYKNKSFDIEKGQLVSSYYASTLLEHEAGTGLDLCGGVDSWKVDASTLDHIIEWARTTLDTTAEPDVQVPRM